MTVPVARSVLSSSVHALGIPHDDLAWLRENDPVSLRQTNDEHLVPRAWEVTRHADVVALEVDDQRLSAAPGFTLHRRPIFTEPHRLNTDGAEHERLRRLVSRGFTDAGPPAIELSQRCQTLPVRVELSKGPL
jgi:cholest-4-en-3-one 26-monooxygenase